MIEIQTERLRLIALTLEQLRRCLNDLPQLERELGLPVSHEIFEDVVLRAIGMKIDQMEQSESASHPWYTYWLIVVSGGVGLAGFKGVPDEQGIVEIGYGITPDYRRKGYMTETVRALIDWAFEHPDCLAVIAPGTLKSNPASNRVLEKVGMSVYDETEDALSWRIDKGKSG